jgi:DNA replication and repair protein RecF
MHIQHLAMKNFRNLRQVEMTPDRGFNILWGENAQGKTNILEAIYLLGNLKSFRGARNEELIRHDCTRSTLAGDILFRDVRRRIELEIEARGKRGRVDGKEARSAGNFLGHLCPVLFSPEEVGLVKGPPSGRRALVDRAVFQTEPAYLAQAQEYRRCLKQRNRLLKEKRNIAEIEPWTEGFIKAGSRIRRARHLYLERLQPLLGEAYGNISGGREEAGTVCPSAGLSLSEIEEDLRRETAKLIEREFALGQTLAGPHRDDIRFLVNGRSLRLYGSQGQQRSFILAFKAAQIMDLEQIIGESPVLLLDDMTSELDRRRQEFFFHFLRHRRGQVFITTTDIRPLVEGGFGDARFFRVAEGDLEDIREKRG